MAPPETSAATPARRQVGLSLLRDLLLVAMVLHGLNAGSAFTDATWLAFHAWELLGAGVCAAALLFWQTVPTRHRVWTFALPVGLIVLRWCSAWSIGSAHEVYTSTVSFLLYVPFLVAIGLLIGLRRSVLLTTAGALACVGLAGSFRPDLAGEVVSDWRLGPSVLGVAVLLVAFFNRWRSFFGDLAQAHEREQQLALQLQAETAQQLVQRMDSANRMSGALAHELNNLLAVVHPLSEQLAADLSGEQRDDALDILASSERARQLGQRLLMLTQHQPTIVEPCRIDALLQHKREDLRTVVGAEHTLRLDLFTQFCFVRIEPREFFLIIKNLLENASEASPKGTTIELSLRCPKDDPTTVLVSVADEGIGLDADLQTTAFDAFVSSHEEAGRGLGLTTAYAIAARAGGKLSLVNRQERGARAILRLPLTDPTEEAPTQALASVPPPAAAPTPLRVLLVDDEPMVLRATRRALERKGCSVSAHLDPSAALDALLDESQAFDVVLSDVRMPRMSGPELYRRTLSLRPGAPPFLFITGHIDEQAAKQMGVVPQQILHKPCPPGQLMDRLRWVHANQPGVLEPASA